MHDMDDENSDDDHASHAGHDKPLEPKDSGHKGMDHGGERKNHAGMDHGSKVTPGSHHAHMVADYRKRFWVSLALTPIVLILSPDIQGFLGFGDSIRFTGDLVLLFLIASVLFFYGGYPFLKGFVEDFKNASPGMMTLVTLAITTAYAYSSVVIFGLSGKIFYWELATLIDVMLLGHWMEMKSIMGASKSLEELAKLMPTDAHKITDDGSTIEVPLGELRVGDRIMVKPGEKIAADGEIIGGDTSINEAMLTGESKPVRKEAGDMAIGGSINGEGSVTIKISKTGKDSFLSQVIDLVKQAQESKSKTQDLANRAAKYLTIVGITSGLLTLIVWFTVLNQQFAFALERTVTVLVITCPHALGLAIPLVVAVSTSLSAKHGLLIRDRTAFENARNIDAIIFDKTGTLTEGKFGITDVLVFSENIDRAELINYAASVEASSEHPIARAIAEAGEKKKSFTDFLALTGRGAQAKVDGRDVKVVSPGYLNEFKMVVDDERLEKLLQQGKTVVFVLIDDVIKGAIALADVIREQSRQAIAKLKSMEIKTMMLTGDNSQVAKWVADELSLDEYFAEVLPQDKAAKIREVQSRGMTVAMTGDGVNDAPALAQADVGIAIGAGTDVAVETADVILVNSDPMDAISIISLSKATYRKMIENLAWATGYNVVAIPLAAGVLFTYGILLTPAIGAALMSLSTIIVAINARFIRIR